MYTHSPLYDNSIDHFVYVKKSVHKKIHKLRKS